VFCRHFMRFVGWCWFVRVFDASLQGLEWRPANVHQSAANELPRLSRLHWKPVQQPGSLFNGFKVHFCVDGNGLQ
jgi:hypothetical protein